MHRLAWSAAAIAVLAGCPKRIEFGPEGRIDDPEALLRLVAEAEARVLTLRGESKVRADTPQAKGAFSMFVAVARPALLHLEPLDFFGKPQAVLSVDGERFGLYSAQDNTYYRGPASPQNVSRILPIVLPAGELTQILLGAAPRIPHETAVIRLDERCACYELTLRKGEVTQVLRIDPRHHRVLASQIEGVSAYQLAFEDHAEYGKIVFPRHLALRAPNAGIDLELRYAEVTLNESPDLTLFEVEPPEDVRVVDVDAEGRPAAGAAPGSG